MTRQAMPSVTDVHPIDCSCHPCVEARGDADRPMTINQIACWSLAGAGFANLLAFAIDPSGAVHAVVDALRQLVGL